MERKSHWDNIYLRKDETEVSWYQTHLEKSLQHSPNYNLNTLYTVFVTYQIVCVRITTDLSWPKQSVSFARLSLNEMLDAPSASAVPLHCVKPSITEPIPNRV